MNSARNTGGSHRHIGSSNVLAHREQCPQSRLVEHAIPSSVQYQETLQQVQTQTSNLAYTVAF